jgi:hypothetical protein
MSAKKRQTMEKFRREQAVRKKREDKAQRKAEAKAAKAAGTYDYGETPHDETIADPQESPLPATVETTKSESGLREAPSSHVHQQ